MCTSGLPVGYLSIALPPFGLNDSCLQGSVSSVLGESHPSAVFFFIERFPIKITYMDYSKSSYAYSLVLFQFSVIVWVVDDSFKILILEGRGYVVPFVNHEVLILA